MPRSSKAGWLLQRAVILLMPRRPRTDRQYSSAKKLIIDNTLKRTPVMSCSQRCSCNACAMTVRDFLNLVSTIRTMFGAWQSIDVPRHHPSVQKRAWLSIANGNRDRGFEESLDTSRSTWISSATHAHAQSWSTFCSQSHLNWSAMLAWLRSKTPRPPSVVGQTVGQPVNYQII